jgi:hypothetical protein
LQAAPQVVAWQAAGCYLPQRPAGLLLQKRPEEEEFKKTRPGDGCATSRRLSQQRRSGPALHPIWLRGPWCVVREGPTPWVGGAVQQPFRFSLISLSCFFFPFRLSFLSVTEKGTVKTTKERGAGFGFSLSLVLSLDGAWNSAFFLPVDQAQFLLCGYRRGLSVSARIHLPIFQFLTIQSSRFSVRWPKTTEVKQRESRGL